MIVVKIELWSAVSGERSEIGRMYIANDGNASREDPTRGDYDVVVCRRGSSDVPAPLRNAGPNPMRRGRVEGFPRKSYNVWRLVSRALRSAFPEEK